MTEEEKIKRELNLLIEETTTHLGGTNQTYVRFLTMLNEAGKLSVPRTLFYGQMIFFRYKPQNKKFIADNKYYDRFPLVIVTKTHRKSFEGINLHLLAPMHREMLLEIMLKNLPTISMGEEWRKRLRVDYERLNSRMIFKFFKPCYRNYLWSGVVRRPAVVPFELWEDMVAANTGRIVNSVPLKVYRESYKKAIRYDR